MTIAIILVIIVFGGGALVWHLRQRVAADDRFHDGLVHAIRLESEAFGDGGDIPTTFTCRGESVSPPLAWSDLPEGTKSLALLVTDEDLPTAGLRLFKIEHWTLYDIPAEIDALAADAEPASLQERGISIGQNWSRERSYAPPCPPFGRHRYVFRVYALDQGTIEPVRDTRGAVLNAMQDHVLACGTLTGYYAR